jgi:hypothetical protein
MFEFSHTNGNVVNVGETDSILIRFSPQAISTVYDTLYIVTNASVNQVIKIALTGNGLYIPPKLPENVIITQSGYDMFLSWDAVTEDIQNNPITPDGYIVLYSEDEINYFFHGFTPNTFYTHYWVARFEDNMFYRILAFKDYGRGDLERLIGLNGTKRKLRPEDLGIN